MRMTLVNCEKIPVVRLVRFVACLTIAAGIFAGMYGVSAMNLVGNIPQPPSNSYSATGGIQLWTNPGNAYIEVNPTNGNMPYGGWSQSTGSYTLNDIPANVNYQIIVTKAGYLPYTTNLYVNPHIIAEAHPELQPDTPASGTLDISIIPYGGIVCIDGSQCETYPLDASGELSRQVQNLDGDQYHTVTVVLGGYRPFSQDVWVPAGDTGRLRATLQRI
ncbi:MAG: hypothetical protein WC586_10320 [Methanoregula sp.]